MTRPSDYPTTVIAAFEQLARECCLCYQCGTCTSSCPSGHDLDRGPRRLVRLLLAGDIDTVLRSDELWRCTGCGACTEACRMQIDVADVLRRLRALAREHATTIRCPERSAAEIAAVALRRRPRLGMMQFGLAMAARGHLPKDKVGAIGMGVRLGSQMVPLGKAGSTERQSDVTEALPFYAGCALRQNRRLLDRVHDVAAGFGVRLVEANDDGCCGHPSRDAVPSRCSPETPVTTACPACDASLEQAGVATIRLWDALTTRAQRRGLALQAAAPRFIPYVGCLADRDASLSALDEAADLAAATAVKSHQTLHSGCCGALGGAYRGASGASAALLGFAADQRAPIVSPCSLCVENLRSAARELKRDVTVFFWPEFFRVAESAREGPTDA